MKSAASFILILLLTGSLQAKSRLDSLLTELDLALKQEKEYTTQKLDYFAKLKEQLQRPDAQREDLYVLNQNLAKEYETFVCDSAIVYSTRAITLAREMGNNNRILDSSIQLADSEAKAGMFIKAIDILGTIDSRQLDLLRLTTKTDNSTQELKELYANFDEAFLGIYPTFVEEFNALLRPEEQYPVEPTKALNQELRIFALIRLGIKDTNMIATFLNYTPRTVYNYRSKVKAKATEAGGDFEERVKLIGAG